MGAAMRYQPQGMARISTGNPLAAGLAGSFIPTSGKAVPVGGAARKLTPSGIGFATSAATDYWTASPTALASLSPTWTILAVLTGAVSVGNAGGSALYTERPNNTQIVKLGLSPADNTAQLVVRDSSGTLIFMSGVSNARADNGNPRVIIGTRRASNDHRLYLNGKFDASITTNVSGAFAATNAVIGNDLQDTGSHLAGGSIPLVLVWNRALTDSEIARISANPWQVFDAGSSSSAYQSAIAWAAAGGAQLRTVNASGGIALAGVAASARSSLRQPAGGLQLAGTTQQSRNAARVTTGGMQLAGAATKVRTRAATPAGGVQFSGAASATTNVVKQVLTVVTAGGIAFAGAAVRVASAIRAATGGLTVGGFADYTNSGIVPRLSAIMRRRARPRNFPTSR